MAKFSGHHLLQKTGGTGTQGPEIYLSRMDL